VRKVPLAGAAAALVLGLAGVAAFSVASQAAGSSAAPSKTLVFDVVFSPFSPIAANNVRPPNSPFALGDELTFHDQLLTGGTGIYRSVGGDGTLVEFGNGKGRLTLHVLSLVPRGGGA
jgi:hypothetical protein